MNHKELNQYRDDLHGRVIRIETILDESLPKIEKHLGGIDDKLREQNGRVRILEDSKGFLKNLNNSIYLYIAI